MIETTKSGRTTIHHGDSNELLENFKRELREQIDALKIEDDPHVMLIVAKGHEDAHFYSCACPGSVMKWGIEMLENVARRSADNRQVPMAKGGEA